MYYDGAIEIANVGREESVTTNDSTKSTNRH